MGSVSLSIGDGTARFRRSTLCPSFVHLVMLLSVLVTNLFALYAFTSSPSKPHSGPTTTIHPELAAQISSIHREISLSERRLRHIELELAGYPSLDPTSPNLPTDLKIFLSRHPLPLGPDSRSAITHLLSSVSHTCAARAPDLLSQFSSYVPRSLCPSADLPSLPLNLISLGCDPLPRRRCLSRSHPRSHLPSPLPSLNSKNAFPLSTVLTLSRVRIGLDLNADSADFAAALSSHNVTVVTTSASEIHVNGLLSLLVSPAQRFPFYDNIFDLVHVTKGLDEGGEGMEFWMFDVDRVVRPGGLLWLDNYCFGDDERKRGLMKLIERFGYKKMKWVVGEKGGEGKGKVYLSAVLKKPVRA